MERRPKGDSRPEIMGSNNSNSMQEGFVKLNEAESLRQQGKIDRAIVICEALVRRHPEYWGAQHTLGLSYADKKDYQRALNCLVRATMLDPSNWMTLTALGGIYLQLGATQMAAMTLEQANLTKPRDANILCSLGEAYRSQNEFALARHCFSQALDIEPGLIPAAMGLGGCSAELGEFGVAADTFEKIAKRGLGLLEPLLELAALPQSFVKLDLLRELENALKANNPDNESLKNSIAFARASALDAAGRFSEAWETAVLANKRIFTSKHHELSGLRQMEAKCLSLLQASPGQSHPTDSSQPKYPISLFILGPSRSGKTTLERLVSTLPGVQRGYESLIVQSCVRRTLQTAGFLTGSFLENLPRQLVEVCHDEYIKELKRRLGSSQVITNTNPILIYDAARLATTFRNVRFIFVKRNIENNLFRIFMSEYEKGNSYAYDLAAARQHLMWYHQMLDVMVEKFPDIVRTVEYEDMIDRPASILEEAANLCDLPMHDGPVPKIDDDRGCSKPYAHWIAAALGAG